MKGFTEFKCYRTRIIYDPVSKEFVTRKEEQLGFDAGDAKVKPETQTQPVSANFVATLLCAGVSRNR